MKDLREKVGAEVYSYASELVDEWFDNVVPELFVTDAEGNLVGYETKPLAPEGYGGLSDEPVGDFQVPITWINDGTEWLPPDTTVPTRPWRTGKFARTLKTLGSSSGKPFTESELYNIITEYDRYGGITNMGVKGTETGFYHTEDIDGKTYIIDPLGNPFYLNGINSLYLGETENLRKYAVDTFGSPEGYYRGVSAILREAGVNGTYAGETAELMKVEGGLSGIVSINVTYDYMRKIGLYTGIEGKYFKNNDTVNVFEPGYIEFTNERFAKVITENGYAENKSLMGYIADNELPSGSNLLERYLTLDAADPDAAYSSATAWCWLSRRLGKAEPTLADFMEHADKEKINSEFLGFLYARMYRVIRDAIRAVDPHHMYFGSRVNGSCVIDPYWLRAAGKYLDVLTINLYGGFFPKLQTIENFYRYSGRPFIVSEFFAKAEDAIDAGGYRLCNSHGAGILVKTQATRGIYFENYILTIMQSGHCAGWLWYRFRDNDPSHYRSIGKNNTLRIQNVTANKKLVHNYRDENDNIVLPEEAGEVEEIYFGEPIASNMNVNKGYFNADFTSVVTVYRLEEGKFPTAASYKVEKPCCECPSEGTVLKQKDGDKTFTIGTVKEGEVTYETVLTVYEGKYVAMLGSVKAIGDHLIGIIRYFE